MNCVNQETHCVYCTNSFDLVEQKRRWQTFFVTFSVFIVLMISTLGKATVIVFGNNAEHGRWNCGTFRPYVYRIVNLAVLTTTSALTITQIGLRLMDVVIIMYVLPFVSWFVPYAITSLQVIFSILDQISTLKMRIGVLTVEDISKFIYIVFVRGKEAVAARH